MDEHGRLRSWGGTFARGTAFPLAALAAALLVFVTTDVTATLVVGLVLALAPWALIAGEVRIHPWVMTVGGVGIAGAVVYVCEAPGATFLALLAVAWLAADGRSRVAEIVAGVGGTIVIPALIAFEDWSEEREAFVFFATGGLITWCVGRILLRERRLVEALTEARERLDEAAAAAERQRIARDIHDVVGHSLTVMLLNVAGARRVLPADPDTAAEALDRAEQVGRDSLQSIRAVVGLLRTPDEHGTEAPRPGAGDIVSLVGEAAAAGLPVRSEIEGDLATVDPYAGLAAFRLVQEAISNVEHHAPGSDVVVRVANDGEQLTVAVRNGPARGEPSAAPPGRRGGTGLDGMRQRLGALGGTVTAGPLAGYGWVVSGTIPLRRSSAAGSGTAGAGR
jgi:signal transduction histidine kinase